MIRHLSFVIQPTLISRTLLFTRFGWKQVRCEHVYHHPSISHAIILKSTFHIPLINSCIPIDVIANPTELLRPFTRMALTEGTQLAEANGA